MPAKIFLRKVVLLKILLTKFIFRRMYNGAIGEQIILMAQMATFQTTEHLFLMAENLPTAAAITATQAVKTALFLPLLIPLLAHFAHGFMT